MDWYSPALLKGLLNLFKCEPMYLNSPVCTALIIYMFKMQHLLTKGTSNTNWLARRCGLIHRHQWADRVRVLGCPVSQHIWILCTHLHHIKSSHKKYAVLHNSSCFIYSSIFAIKCDSLLVKYLKSCSSLHIFFPKF